MEGAANRPLDKQQGDASFPTQGNSNASPEIQDISSPGNPEGGLTSDVGVKAASKASKDNTLPKGQGAGKAVNFQDMQDTSSVVNQPNSAGVREEYETQDEEEEYEEDEYEEVEQIDELSKDTLKSYYKKSVESGMKAQHRATNTLMGGSDSEHKKNIADINKRVSGQDAVTKRLGSKETMSMDKEAGVSRRAKYKPTKPNPKKYSEEYEYEEDEEYEEYEYATEEGLFEEDLRALFADDENLTEEFKTKAAEIFEAVVSSRVISEVEAIEVELTEQANAAYAERVEELVESIDKYLNYATENWMQENEMAIENGLRNEITESFIKGLQQVFTEHYIEVPEDKYDVLAEMQEKLDALESNLNEEIQKNINLNEEAVYLKKQNIFSVVSEDLADTEAEKFATLVEDITYTSDESYNNKLKVVKENYFRKTSVNTSADNALEDTVNELVSQDNSIMSKYAKAISKHSKF